MTPRRHSPRLVHTAVPLALCILWAASAFADGKMFIWRNENVDIFQPSQKAVIAWDGATETLTLQTKYEGPAEEMAWLVPVPAEPEVEKGNPGLFDEMSQRTQEPYILYTKFESPRASVSRGARALEWRRRIGAYDVALLKPVGGQTVLEWLEANEFGVEPEAKPILSNYIDRGWWMVASRIHKEALVPSVQERLAKGTLEPLELTFKTDQCVYPLHLTSLAAGPVEVLLWIKGSNHYEPVTLADGPWQIDFYRGPTGPRDTWRFKNWVRFYDNPMEPDAPIECITKLRRTFQPSEMTYDVYFGPADYVKHFDAQDPIKVGTVATQFGLWRDPAGAEPLVRLLSTGTPTDEPHVRSAVWALGEIAKGGVLSPEIDEILLHCVETGPYVVRMEAYLALAKSDYDDLGGLFLMRLRQLADTVLVEPGQRSEWMPKREFEVLAAWLGEYSSGPARDGYIGFLVNRINEITRQARILAAPGGESRWHELWGEGGGIVLALVRQVRDERLIPSLAELRIIEQETLKADPSLQEATRLDALFTETLCGSESALHDFVDRLVAEESRLFETCRGENGDVFSLGELEAGGRQHSLRGLLLGDRDVLTRPKFSRYRHLPEELTHGRMPPDLRDRIAHAALSRDGMNPWYALYLMSWLDEPNETDFARLRRFWEDEADPPEATPLQRTFVVDVAMCWNAVDLLLAFLDQEEDGDVREEILWALANTKDAAAWPVLEQHIRNHGNEALAGSNTYTSWTRIGRMALHEPDNPDEKARLLGRPRTLEAVERFIESMLESDEGVARYDALCGDSSLCPELRFLLLSIHPWRFPWMRPHAEALFREVAATNPPDELTQKLAILLGQARATDTLVELWEDASDFRQRDIYFKGLRRTYDARLIPILGTMVREFWYEQFRDSGGDHDALNETASALRDFRKPQQLASLRIFLQDFLTDKSFDPGYRAWFAVHAPPEVHSSLMPQFRALLNEELPADIRRQLAIKRKEVKDREARLAQGE